MKLSTLALLLTMTALPAIAQDAMPTITPPEGFAPYADPLTTEALKSAKIYDSEGKSIGEVVDFVLGAGMATDATTGAMNDTTGTATDTTATDTTATDTTTGAAADTTATETTGAATDTTADTTTTATDTTTGTATDTTGAMADTTTSTDATGTADTTTGAMADTTATGTDATTGAMADTTTTGTDTTTTGTAADTTTTADTTTAPATDTSTTASATDTAAPAETAPVLTHAIIDVGGFLGMGEHRVAIPINDLRAFRNDNNDLQIFLPWTKDQLEALPSYDPADAATLGQPMMTNG